MNDTQQKQLGVTLWGIADKLRGAMNPDDFRDYMLSFLFLRYLSDNYEEAAKKELRSDYLQCEEYVNAAKSEKENKHSTVANFADFFSTEQLKENFKKMFAGDNGDSLEITVLTPLLVWYAKNADDVAMLEKQMRRKLHYVIKPHYLWSNIYELARTQSKYLLRTLQDGFKFIENESFDSAFRGLFSEVNLDSDKLGRNYEARNTMLCSIITEIAEGLSEFTNETDLLGNAYEYLIGQFAAGSGKKAGEFYTPQQISTILSRIVILDS
ncbi:MAG: type I restriction-modification system subunit M N-terminal domain-containing protein, partial [Bacillota bacterium]